MYITRPIYSDNNSVHQYHRTIDSLDNKIVTYQKRQLYLDSIIAKYRIDINELDHKIDSTKQLIVIQRKDYEKRIRNASRYSATELDTFFADRYKK